jgi:predicted signal transduction protein with EAL and GGDEF domain
VSAIKRPASESAPAPASERSLPIPETWSDWQRERLSGIEAALAPPAAVDRHALLDTLNGAIRESIASGIPAAAVLIDIDDFAEINATWGPTGGDEVLATAAARIGEFCADRMRGRIGSVVATGRLDADHFMVVVAGVANADGLRDIIVELLRTLGEPVSRSGRTLALRTRAALVRIPVHGRSVTTVLSRVFRLLNGAARTKPDRVAMSEAEAAQDASAVLLERDLAAALATDQLFIALQPKVEVASGAVRGAEALARWHHPERGLLPPQLFIEPAEKSGLIFDLGLRVLRDACRASNRLAVKRRPLQIAVNVSPHQLTHPEFLSRFLEVIDREGVEPKMLEIEITESAAMMGGQRVHESLQALRRCGIGVAIDDFGTGFSNLASLSALPADTLKIDRSLVTAIEQGGKAGALLDIAVQLGRTLGLSTIAEGVETTEQYQRVTHLGCDLVQGYFTGRPVRANEFADYYLRR